MSVGILQIPGVCAPAYNKLYFVVSGSMSAQNNYKLIALIKDLSGNTIAKVKQPTDATYTTNAAFDLHRIIENYVTQTIDIGAIVTTKASSNYLAYTVEFGEEYGSPTTAEYYYGTVTGTLLSPNIALSNKESLAFNSSDYFLGSGTRLFLNKYKGVRKVFNTSKSFLYFMQELSNSSSLVQNIGVVAYDIAGNVIATTEIIQPYGGTSDSEVFLYLPSGPANLNLILQSNLSSGTQGAVIPAATYRYEIKLIFNSTSYFFSEVMNFTVISNCGQYDNYPVYFLGQHGQVELWNFNKKSYKNSEISRKVYISDIGRFLTATSFGFTNQDRQETQYDTEVSDSVTVNSDIMSDAEYLFMKELIESPQVWVLDGSDLLPVTITDNTYVLNKKVNSKLFNFSFTFKYSSALKLQRY